MTASARDAVSESLGPPRRPPAAERADAAVRRAASRPRSDEPAGVRRAARARVAGAGAGADVRDRRPHRADARAGAAVSRSDGRDDGRGARAELPRRTASRCSILPSGSQGIVHVIGPELGLTQPGMTIVCGDSHTSTHGAFGALAFGIGTSQVRDVLASQSIAMSPLKVRRIDVTGALASGVYAKDVILTIIGRLGIKAGTGFAYEYAGDTIARMSMDERMTICNMSIEGGARIGYVNPDDTTFAYLRGRRFAPKGAAFDRAVRVVAEPSRPIRARAYDDRVAIDAAAIAPTVTWGINPGQVVAVDGRLPDPAAGGHDRAGLEEALEFMGFRAGQPMAGTKIDVAFIGSCTNGASVRPARGRARSRRAARSRRTCARSSCRDRRPWPSAAEREGLDDVFRDGRIRMARRRLLDVPRDEHRSPRRPRDLRVLVQPQFQGPAGQPDRPHAADEPGDGRGRRGRRRSRGRAVVARGRRAVRARERRDDQLVTHARRRPRDRPAAATTSTPTASCPRAFCARSRSTASKRTCSKTIAGASRRRARRIRSTTQRAGPRACSSSARISAAARRASTRRRRFAVGDSRDRRRVVRGDLLRQRGRDRPAVRDRRGATTRRCSRAPFRATRAPWSPSIFRRARSQRRA